MIKTADTEDGKMCLRREYRNYRIGEIASSPYFRSLCDTVWPDQDEDNPSSLVFEWMDQTLTSVPMLQFRANQLLPKTVSKAILSALSVLRTLNAIYTGKCTYTVVISSTEQVQTSVPITSFSPMSMEGTQ